jgi:4,5-dihydroxyphthalate decarboxylase
MALMTPNHWKQGFAENYKVLDTMCQYHYEQGLSKRRFVPEELFARETRDQYGAGVLIRQIETN